MKFALGIAVGILGLYSLGAACASCTPAQQAAIGADARTVLTDVEALDPVILGAAECIGSALESNLALNSAVNDIDLAIAVAGCFRDDAGASAVSQEQALAIVKSRKAPALARVAARKVAVSVDAGVAVADAAHGG